MKICIFESQHFEGAYPVIKLFDNGKNGITILTNNETKSRFEDMLGADSKNYAWKIIDSRKNKLSYFLEFRSALKKIKPDILYLNTVNDNHLLYALGIITHGKQRVILTVHDINCLFMQKPGLEFKSLVQALGKSILRRRVQELNVVSDTMQPYLRQVAGGNKKIHNIPGAVFEKKFVSADFSIPVKISIPGSIDKKRRDYDQVFELAQFAEDRKLLLDITLLGGYSDAYGKAIAGKASACVLHYARIHAFNEEVISQERFDKMLAETHFIWIPSVINTSICGKIPEVYGLTKSSGNIFDIIRHAKPFIIPQKLRVPASIESSGLRYSSLVDLIQLIQSMVADKGIYDNYTKAAFENSLKFTIEKIREKNADLFAD